MPGFDLGSKFVALVLVILARPSIAAWLALAVMLVSKLQIRPLEPVKIIKRLRLFAYVACAHVVNYRCIDYIQECEKQSTAQ